MAEPSDSPALMLAMTSLPTVGYEIPGYELGRGSIPPIREIQTRRAQYYTRAQFRPEGKVERPRMAWFETCLIGLYEACGYGAIPFAFRDAAGRAFYLDRGAVKTASTDNPPILELIEEDGVVRYVLPTAIWWARKQAALNPNALKAAPAKDAAPFDVKQVSPDELRRSATAQGRKPHRQFREDVLAAYGGRCAITSCDVTAALEAVHIVGHGDSPAMNDVQNGVLLRADLAALYDDGWFGLQWRGPELILVSSADVQVTEYERLLEASVFRLPTDPGRVPHSELVDAHRKFKMRERGKV